MFTIKRLAVFVSIIFLSLSYAAADPASAPGAYSLSFSPLTGILIGQGEEFLYKYQGKNQYESQLLWDLKPLWYVGFASDFGPRDPFARDGFIASGSLKFGLPFKTGSIEDRDWDDSRNDDLTNYSKHDAYSQNAIFADISAGYSWPLNDFLALSASGKFSYMYLSWMAEDGYLQYAKMVTQKPNTYDTSHIDYRDIYGPGIRYTQHWFIFAPVLSLRGKINQLFSVSGNFSYTPLVYCTDTDDHLLPLQGPNGEYWSGGKTFSGYFPFGTYINGGANVTFSPLQKLDLTLSVSYMYITGLRGSTFVNINGISGYSYQDYIPGTLNQNYYDGGAGYSALDIELTAKITIF